jgi:glutamate 5-kinase
MSTKIVAARLATSAGVTTVITRSSNPGNIVKIVKHIQASRSPPSLATKANQFSDSPDRQGGTESPLSRSGLLPSASSTSLSGIAAAAERSQTSTPVPEQKIPLHTRFLPSPHPIRELRFWVLHGVRPRGTLYIDQGAYKALLRKAGLLPVGVVDVDGQFAQHEAVRLCVVERKKRVPGDGLAEEASDKEKEGASSKAKLWEGEPVEVGRALSNYSKDQIRLIMGRQSSEIKEILGYSDSQYVAERGTVSLFAWDSRPATPVRELGEDKEDSGFMR